jgi:hypothetical protein
MGQVRGITTVMALGEESTYGTAATGNFVKIFHAGESLSASRNLIDSQTLSGGRVRSEPIAGNWDVTGDIRTEINCESMLFLLKHAVESVPTKTGAAAPWTFTFEPDTLHTGFTLEVDYGADISGAGRVKQLVGCRMAGFTMDFPSEGIPQATWRVVGAKPTVPAPSALTDATPATIGTHQPFSAFQIGLTEEGSALATATSLQLSYDNGIEAVFAIGGAGARVSAPEGFVSVSGQLEAIFNSATLLNKALNSTESKLEVTLTRGAGTGASTGNEKLTITLEELKYEPAFPVVEGPSGLLVRLPFKCYLRSTANAFKAVALIPNDISTIGTT